MDNIVGITSVMTACEVPLDKLNFPLYASYKIDGIRCFVHGKMAISRSIKPIRNKFVQQYLAEFSFHGLDGELTVGEGFQSTTSGIMTVGGEPDFNFHVFDLWCLQMDFTDRYRNLRRIVNNLGSRIKPVKQTLCFNIDDVLNFEKEALEKGYEGVMLRRPDSPYKQGQSTEKEQYLIKRKPFVDEECEVIGFEEQLQNTNEIINGERSSHIANLIPKGTLGKFLVRSDKWGEFAIGTGQGLTKKLRQEIWNNHPAYMGKLIKFKYQNYGIKDLPRLPIFLGFRDRDDL